jgi:hypothetical protein
MWIHVARWIIPQKSVFAYNKIIGFLYTQSFDCAAKNARLRSGRISYKENLMRKTFGFLIGIFVGALVGSTVALLLTPESGSELRSEIRARGAGFAGQIRSAADERRIELRNRLEALRAPREM